MILAKLCIKRHSGRTTTWTTLRGSAHQEVEGTPEPFHMLVVKEGRLAA